MYKHIVWDWNGTILDDRWLWVEAMNHLLRQHSIPEVSDEQYRDDFCFPLSAYFKQVGFDLQREAFDRLALQFIELYQNRWRECALHADARNVFNVFAKRGLTQSVLSAIEHEFLKEMVRFHELTAFFSGLLGIGDHFAASKLENGRRHMERLRLRPSDVLFIGDTVHDYEVATDMGVACLLVAHGHNSRGKLQATGAEVVASMREIEYRLIRSGS